MAAYRYHLGERYCCRCERWYPGTLIFCPLHGKRLRAKPTRIRKVRGS